MGNMQDRSSAHSGQRNTVTAMRILIIAISLMTFSSGSQVSASETDMLRASTDIHDKESLRRGAQFFIDNCTSCHAAKFMRYDRMSQDLDITEEDVMKNMVRFGASRITDSIPSAISPEAGEQLYGVMPPDLSLEARYRGVDWVYSYLMGFYQDDSATYGFNNRVLSDVAMPWTLAGYQASATEEEFSGAMRDLTNFMDYIAEPIKPWRERFGKYIIIFLLIMLVPVWLLRKEYWKDLH